LLKTIVREADRQLIVAVHERALFDYLRIELGPTRDEESLITIEMERTAAGNSTTIAVARFTWQPDRVVFRAASSR